MLVQQVRISPQVISVLLVNACDEDRASLRRILSRSNWNVYEACGEDDALRLLQAEAVPVVICARELPDGDWHGFLKRTRELAHPPHVIVNSPSMDKINYLWSEALREGAYDVIASPYTRDDVVRTVTLAWHSWRDERKRSRVSLNREQAPVETASASSAGEAAYSTR